MGSTWKDGVSLCTSLYKFANFRNFWNKNIAKATVELHKGIIYTTHNHDNKWESTILKKNCHIKVAG